MLSMFERRQSKTLRKTGHSFKPMQLFSLLGRSFQVGPLQTRRRAPHACQDVPSDKAGSESSAGPLVVSGEHHTVHTGSLGECKGVNVVGIYSDPQIDRLTGVRYICTGIYCPIYFGVYLNTNIPLQILMETVGLHFVAMILGGQSLATKNAKRPRTLNIECNG